MSFEQAVVQLEQTNAALQEEVIRFRDAAMGLNAIYPTVTEGRQAVADGKYFSVPGSGAYMRLYRRQGSSAELIAEFPDRAQVQGIVDVFGGRGVTGPGDLMAVGFAGLGKDSLNDIDLTGKHPAMFARADSRTDGIFGAQVALINLPYVGTRTAQIAIGISDGGRMKYRTQLAQDEWTPVRTVYDTTNIIGSVSQSGGIPTGAVFEEDNNDFGGWTKFACGRIFFWSEIENIDINLEISTGSNIRRSDNITWPLPQPVYGPISAGGRITNEARAIAVHVPEGGVAGVINQINNIRAYVYGSSSLARTAILSGWARWY